jgi:hypothetical protein
MPNLASRAPVGYTAVGARVAFGPALANVEKLGLRTARVNDDALYELVNPVKRASGT